MNRRGNHSGTITPAALLKSITTPNKELVASGEKREKQRLVVEKLLKDCGISSEHRAFFPLRRMAHFLSSDHCRRYLHNSDYPPLGKLELTVQYFARKYFIKKDRRGLLSVDTQLSDHVYSVFRQYVVDNGIVEDSNKPVDTGEHGGHVRDETAEFHAVAAQEDISPVELRTIIDKAKAAKVEVTVREHATAAPRPDNAAPAPGNGLEWPSEKWKGSPEHLSRKQRAIFPFLRRVWVPFIENTGAVVTRQMLKERDADAAVALRNALRSFDMPEDIRIMPTRDLKKTVGHQPMTLRNVAHG